MRVIVYALVLANLLYLGWTEWIDVPPPPAPSSIAGLPHLTLFKELSPDKRSDLAKKMSLEATSPECVSVGPFDDPAIAVQAATLLEAKSYAPRQRAAESPALRRFWVYLDGFRSDASEMRVLHRLERAGIDDAEAMPADADGRRVSLGLFTDLDKAENRMKVVRTMGFQPVMTPRMLPGTVYWLDLTLPSGSAPVPLKDVSDLEPGPGDGSSPISVQSCASIASPTAPSQQTVAPGAAPATAPVPPPQPGSSTASSVPAANLPRCKPGEGGPVPCVVVKATTQPSVL